MGKKRFEQQVLAFKERLRMMIARAELPEGARIDEAPLRAEAGTTVRAARQALRELAREGLIVRKRHVGTYVSGRLPGATFSVLPKLRSVGILSSCPQSFFLKDTFGATVMTGIQLSLRAPSQVTFFVHPEARSMSVDDLPFTDLDQVKRACQGLVAIEAYNAARLNELARGGVPLVAVDFAPPGMAFDAVEADHFRAGYLAAQHLLALGHRRIGYVGEGPVPESTDPTWQARLNGYLRALVEAGLSASSEQIVNIRRSAELIPHALPPVQRRFHPTAYVLCGGGLAPLTAAALKTLGLKVPGDISLSTADSSQQELDGMTLSQARVDYELLGRHAVRLLASRLACKPMPPLRVVQPVSFAPGQTSRPR